MRALIAAVVVAAAGGASAACLPDGQLAKAVHFAGGAVIDQITVKDGIVTYTAHAEGKDSRVRAARGLYPLQLKRCARPAVPRASMRGPASMADR